MTIQNLKFEQITDPEEIKSTHIQNGANWKGPLTLHNYVEREHLLGTTGIARKRESAEVQKKYPKLAPWLGLQYFALKDGDTIISSCETLARLGYYIRPGTQADIQTNLVVCLGSVFTPEEHRSKGYASYLLRKLLEFYDTARDAPNAPPGVNQMVLTLYSEVGEYYKKFGYHSMHVPIHTITEVDAFFKRYCAGRMKSQGKSLREDDYDELIQLQNKELQKHMLRLHKSHTHSFIFSVKSDADLYRWFNTRDIFILQNSIREKPRIVTFGHILEDRSHILWHHLWADDTLVILKFYVHPGSSSKEQDIMKELFAQAVAETKSSGLKRLQFWDEEIPIKKFPELFSAISDLEHDSMVFAENSSLSAVRTRYCQDSVIWENNGKYCWF